MTILAAHAIAGALALNAPAPAMQQQQAPNDDFYVSLSIHLVQLDQARIDELVAQDNAENAVPLLGDVPLIGELFRAGAEPRIITDSSAHAAIKVGDRSWVISPSSMLRHDNHPSPPPFTILSAPSIGFKVNKPASLNIGQVIPYLTRDDTGCLTVHEDESLFEGITIEVNADKADDKGVSLSTFKVGMSTLTGRQPIEGVPLDVGRPIIHTQTLSAPIYIAANSGVVLPVPRSADQGDPILITIHARPHGSHVFTIAPKDEAD